MPVFPSILPRHPRSREEELRESYTSLQEALFWLLGLQARVAPPSLEGFRSEDCREVPRRCKAAITRPVSHRPSHPLPCTAVYVDFKQCNMLLGRSFVVRLLLFYF